VVTGGASGIGRAIAARLAADALAGQAPQPATEAEAMGRLAGRVAVITGAGSGIGRVSARLFASEGAAVAMFDLNGDGAAETVKEIAAEGGDALGLPVDVSNAGQVTEAVDEVLRAWGRLDILFNNAGVSTLNSILESDEAEWDTTYAVNVKGTFFCAQACAPHLGVNGTGAIVNQASVAGLVGVRNLCAYSASKGAVIALTRSMAVELAPGIRVNAICPGTTVTPMIEGLLLKRGGGDPGAGLAETIAKYPLGRLGQPEDIARVALFFASDDAAFLTGCILPADGGMSMQ
jgi:NAD(P)-dependent dehydrogenase (short-subunit alcohol dehydrogenase family)